MYQKNETLKLFLAILVTIGVIFGGLWFLLERWAQINKPNPVPVANQSLNENSGNRIGDRNTCNVSSIPAGTFNYGGSTTWATIRKDVNPILESICPQFILRCPQGAGNTHSGLSH